MSQEMDEMELFYADLAQKIADRCSLIKKIMENPTKLHKIKKNQIVHAIQQEIENEQYMDDQQYFQPMDEQDELVENLKKQHASLPTVSTNTNNNHQRIKSNNRFI